MDKVILHCDMNSFFAQVSLLDYPHLRDKPVAVAGNPKKRHGVILAKNEAAKKYDVRTAETVWQATNKCPDLILLPPKMGEYKYYSRLINQIYLEYTDQVEPFSIDESWLDVTESQRLFGDGKAIADAIREEVKAKYNLTLSAGVSFTKTFAKMGSEMKKPDATTVISRENYKDILWPMPVSEMFMVGRATAKKLNAAGIKTIGDLALADREFVRQLLGKLGPGLADHAAGLAGSQVATFDKREAVKSVGNGLTFNKNLVGTADIQTAVRGLADKIASRLRKKNLYARGLKVDIKDPLFQSFSRQEKWDKPSNSTDDIVKSAMNIIYKAWNPTDPIRMLTLTGIYLTDKDDSYQISFEELAKVKDNKKSASVDQTLDQIRKRFGDSSITFANLIDNDLGIRLDHHIDVEDFDD